MVAKMVVDREKSVSLVGAAVQTHAATAAARIAARLLPHVGGEPIRADALLHALKGLVEHGIGQGVAASDAHDAELADNAPLLTRRNEKLDALREVVLAGRDAVVAGWGTAGLAAHGVSGETFQQPDTLLSMARSFGAALANPKLVLPPPRPNVAVDRAAWAGDLATAAEALDLAERAVRLDRREDEGTQDAKDAALAAYDADFGDALPLMAALFRFAGLHRTADRLVPSPRRPGQLDDPEAPLPDESAEA